MPLSNRNPILLSHAKTRQYGNREFVLSIIACHSCIGIAVTQKSEDSLTTVTRVFLVSWVYLSYISPHRRREKRKRSMKRNNLDKLAFTNYLQAELGTDTTRMTSPLSYVCTDKLVPTATHLSIVDSSNSSHCLSATEPVRSHILKRPVPFTL